MSRSFKKSKKALTILLAIAFVLSFALPAFAGVTSRYVPDVNDGEEEALGRFDLEIKKIDDVGEDHVVYIELPNKYDIKKLKITDRDGDPDSTVTNYVYVSTKAGGEKSITDDLKNLGRGFNLIIKEGLANALDASKDVVLRVSFEEVSIPSGVSGNIYATLTGVSGMLRDYDEEVLVGRVGKGELEVSVRSSQGFSDKGKATIRIAESRKGTWNKDDNLTMTLPRGFAWGDLTLKTDKGSYLVIEVWDGNAEKWVSVGDIGDGESWFEKQWRFKEVSGSSFYEGDFDELDAVFGDIEVGKLSFDLDRDGRKLKIGYNNDDKTGVRSGFDLTATIVVDRPELAKEGDVIAELGGDYTVSPDEIVVGVYGDYNVEITADDAEIVYSGKEEQAVANITLKEEIAGTLVKGRAVTMKLPEGVEWQTLKGPKKDVDVGLELDGFIGKDKRTARFTVTADDVEGRTKARSLKLKDMEVMVSANFQGEVEVEFGGSAGVTGTVIVAEAVAPAALEVDELTTIGIGRDDQEIGTIYVTEAEAGLFDLDKDIILRVDKDVEWASWNVEVDDGDIVLGTARKANDGRDLRIKVDADSDEASTIKVTGYVKTYRTIPEGYTYVSLMGAAVVDPATIEINDSGVAAKAAIADVGVPAPPVEGAEPNKVVMNIGSTTFTENGVAKTMDVAPFIEGDRTFVPIRFIAEAFGAEADWTPKDAKVENVYLTKGDTIVAIEIGSATITITEGDEVREVTADVAAQIKGDRTFLPLRAVGEIFGATFDWGPKDAKTTWVSFDL